MTQEKMRKLITALVVSATLLLVILLSVLIYQWIKIGVYNKRIKEVQRDIDYYGQLIDQNENNLDYYTADFYKTLKAHELGFIKGQGE